jgi:hypothetical protein
MTLSVEQLASLGLAGLTAFWLVLEPLIREEKLFACRENEFRSTIDALEDPIPVFHDLPPLPDQSLARCEITPHPPSGSVVVVPGLFAGSFPRQGRFDSLFLSWLQIKGMLFDFLDDVLLLHLSLEAAEGAFQRFSLLKSNFGQTINTPIS